MHEEALRGIEWAVSASGFEAYGITEPLKWNTQITILDALDLGGADVNGSARPIVDKVRQCHWTGADVAAGPGVDWVMDATEPLTEPGECWDVVLCTEVLEHVAQWGSVVGTIHRLLKPGGYTFISCAGTGRRPHGARGEMWPPPGEHYGNVSILELDNALGALFPDWKIHYNPRPGDLYAWARKASWPN